LDFGESLSDLAPSALHYNLINVHILKAE